MVTLSDEERRAEDLRPAHRRRLLGLAVLLALDAFLVGGVVTLLIVYRLLNGQLAAYATAGSMGAAWAILDFADDLLPIMLTYGGLLAGLLLATLSVGTWMVTRSRAMRYGVILVCATVLLVLGALVLLRGGGTPAIPPTTPTPTAVGQVLDLAKSIL